MSSALLSENHSVQRAFCPSAIKLAHEQADDWLERFYLDKPADTISRFGTIELFKRSHSSEHRM